MTREPTSLELKFLARAGWRLQHLYTIKRKDGVLAPFVPNEPQRRFHNAQWWRNHILKARQMGFSTYITQANLDAMLWRPNTTVGLVDNTMPDAKKKLRMVKTSYEHLDDGDLHPDTWRIGRWIKERVPMKFAAEEVVFGNGSNIYCGTSLRGGTVQRLHISELGKTAAKTPEKARELLDGALNAVAADQVVTIESTHEGGRTGLHYAMLQTAMKNQNRELTELDYMFHFFPWFLMRDYALDASEYARFPIRPEVADYFAELARDLGRTFSHGQMLWYDRKSAELGFRMLKEFPSTPDEAFRALVEGAIFGRQMALVRERGGIGEFAPDGYAPLRTCWDIGNSDYTSIWLFQSLPGGTLWLDNFTSNGQGVAAYADRVRAWEAEYGRKIAVHYLPHDAATRHNGRDAAQCYVDLLAACGVRNVRVVPRTPDKWMSIERLRDVLRTSRFCARCDVEGEDELGEATPSAIACLEGYHTKVAEAGGALTEAPVHDEFSHTCDAAMQWADALGLHLDGFETEGRRVRVVR